MRFTSAVLAVLPLATVYANAVEKRQDQATPTIDVISVLSVLQTALPQSIVALALTNSASASNLIAAQFSQGSTPAWFTGLPTDVQQYLVPFATSIPLDDISSALESASDVTTVTETTSIQSTITQTNTAETDATTVTETTVETESSSTQSDEQSTTTETESTASDASASETASSTAGGSMPTAAIGAGIAGAIGILGVLL